MVEPLAVSVRGATKAQVKPGDIAIVIGAGLIGLVTRTVQRSPPAAPASSSPDVDDTKLAIAAKARRRHPGQCRADIARRGGEGRDGRLGRTMHRLRMFRQRAGAAAAVFEPRSARAARSCSSASRSTPIRYDVAGGQIKEVRVEHVFRYAHVYPRCVAMLASGSIDVDAAHHPHLPVRRERRGVRIRAATSPAGQVKIQIEMPD